MSNPKTSRDLAPERRERLQHLLHGQPAMRVEQMARALNVSPATVRRDLALLHQQGRLQRVHGGAISAERRLEEPLFDDKTSVALAEKKRIAAHALSLVDPDDTIYLDGGSTVLELAFLLAERTNLTVVTHSLRAAMALAGNGPRVIVVGGELRRRSQTMVGPLTRLLLDQLHIDKAFMGTIGLTPEQGPTTTDPNEAYTKELVMRQAEQVLLLADSGKVGKVSFAQAGRLDQIDCLITDRGLSARQKRAFKKKLKILTV